MTAANETASDDISDCDTEAGKLEPQINRNRCEAKADCVRVCPFNVFEIQALRPEDKAGLSLRGRLKAWAHGSRQAYVVHGDACHACNRCVTACPENAITLVSRGPA